MNTALYHGLKHMCRIWTCTAQEYTDAMTLSGTKVEGYEATGRRPGQNRDRTD